MIAGTTEDQKDTQTTLETPIEQPAVEKIIQQAPEKVVEKNNEPPVLFLTQEQIAPLFGKYYADKQKLFREKGALLTLKGADTNQETDKNLSDLLTEPMTEKDTLEVAHVDGLLRCLVGLEPALKSTLGIFPVYSAEDCKRMLEEAAYEQLIKDPAYQEFLPATQPLEDTSRSNPEYQKRVQQAQKLRAFAQRNLKESGLDAKTIYLHYLNSIADSKEMLLGNTKESKLDIMECTQCIFPFNEKDYHFTGAIVHLVDNLESKTAFIEFYNSLGGNIPKEYGDALKTFFVEKGYKIEEKTISKHEQRNLDCGIFMATRLVEAALRFKKVVFESRLKEITDTISKQKYDEILRAIRHEYSILLSTAGYETPITDDLKAHLKKQQQKFTHPQSEEESDDVSLLLNFLSETDWESIIFYAALMGTGLFLSWPIVSPILTTMATAFTFNALATIVMGGGIFGFGLVLFEFLEECLKPEEPMHVCLPPEILSEENIFPELERNAPTMLNQFGNTLRQEEAKKQVNIIEQEKSQTITLGA